MHSMNIEDIRRKVDDVLLKKADFKELLKIDLESKHYDVPLLALISLKKHYPEARTDSDFLTLLSIYRKIELEIKGNSELVRAYSDYRDTLSI